jgi:hypothetical protein
VETLELPDHGLVALGPFKLEKLPEGAVAPPPLPANEAPPEAPVVRLTLRTQPAGAQVSVNGQKLGPSPATLPLPAQSDARVVASLGGYRDAEQTFRMGAAGAQEYTLQLEREKRAPTPAVRPPPVQEPAPTAKGQGTVRFVVKPWANVTCNGKSLGQTPFADPKLPAGEYRCTFTNPVLEQEKTVVIVVIANEITKVPVTFKE